MAGVALALASVCFVPAAFVAAANLLGRLSRRIRGSMLPVAVMELRATTTRSIALAGVGALAVYGSVAVEGAPSRSLRGLDRSFGQYLATTDLWVTTGGDDLTTNSFPAAGVSQRIARARGVAGVRRTRAGCSTSAIAGCGSSRAHRTTAPSFLPASCARAISWSRHGTAARRRLGVCLRRVRPPQGPACRRPLHAADADRRDALRVAAITTNLGWPPGGVILNAARLRRAWGHRDPSCAAGRPASGRASANGGEARGRAGARRRARDCVSRRSPSAERSTRRWRAGPHEPHADLDAAADRRGARGRRRRSAPRSGSGAHAWPRSRSRASTSGSCGARCCWRARSCSRSAAPSARCSASTAMRSRVATSRMTTGFPAPFSFGADQVLAAVGARRRDRAARRRGAGLDRDACAGAHQLPGVVLKVRCEWQASYAPWARTLGDGFGSPSPSRTPRCGIG